MTHVWFNYTSLNLLKSGHKLETCICGSRLTLNQNLTKTRILTETAAILKNDEEAKSYSIITVHVSAVSAVSYMSRFGQ